MLTKLPDDLHVHEEYRQQAADRHVARVEAIAKGTCLYTRRYTAKDILGYTALTACSAINVVLFAQLISGLFV